MARCNDCNKFVSYGEPEIEVMDEHAEENALTANVRIALTCAECSGELKEADLDLSVEFEHECEEPKEGEQYEVEAWEAISSERRQTTDAKGKLIKNYRYQKSFYGADITFTVRCLWCDEVIIFDGAVEEQASGFMEI